MRTDYIHRNALRAVLSILLAIILSVLVLALTVNAANFTTFNQRPITNQPIDVLQTASIDFDGDGNLDDIAATLWNAGGVTAYSQTRKPTPQPQAIPPGRQPEPDQEHPFPPEAWRFSTPTPPHILTAQALPIPPLAHTIQRVNAVQSEDFPISALPRTSEESPAIDSGRAVWYDDRTQGPTDVWGYDFATGEQFQVTAHPVAQFIADISGDVVVYEDNRNGTWDIYATDLSTGQEFVVATGPHHQRYPRIWGDYIVYQDETGDYFQSDVYLYEISTGVTTPLAVAPSYQGRPDIDDNWIVWTDWRTGSWQLGIYNLTTKTFAFRTIDCDHACKPRLADHEVVWNGRRRGNYDIYMYDLETGIEQTVYAGPGDQRFPDLSETIIAWQDDVYGNWDVDVYVRDTGFVFPVSSEPSSQITPAVEGNTVVWQDNRSHTWDIYALIWDGTTPPIDPPVLDNPTDLHVGAYPHGEIRLSWTDDIPNETGFVIQRAEGIFGNDWQDYVTLPANTTAWADTSAALSESYWYRVRATNAEGDSRYSNESYSTAFQTVPNLDERYTHLLINDSRVDPGRWGYPEISPVDPLAWQSNLAYSAHAHALGMNNSNCCQGHVDLAGRGSGERAYDSGYPYGTGENLFQAPSGREGMEAAHQGFMDSEGHRNNIMIAYYRHTGVGFAPGGRGTLVHVFSGGPAGTTVPALPSGITVPYTGTVDATFDFLVTFWNKALLAPTRAEVVIDGQTHSMNLRNGNPGRGTYVYSTQLAMGSHQYHFEFVWGNPQESERLPVSGFYDGPYVRPYMPDFRSNEPNSWKLVQGYPGRIYAHMDNDGEIPAENIEVRFYLDDPSINGEQIGETQIIPHLEPGQQTLVEINWTPLSVGDHDIYVVVDPDDLIVEVKEDNNTSHKTLAVRPPGIDFRSNEPNSWKLVQGYPGRIYAHMDNDGEIPAENIEVRFYLDDPSTLVSGKTMAS